MAVGPDDDGAGITLNDRVGGDRGAGCNDRRDGVGFRPRPLIVPADQGGAPTGLARDVNARGLCQSQGPAEHRNLSAFRVTRSAGCVDRSSDLHQPAVSAVEPDDAALIHQAARPNDPAVIHDGREDVAGGLRLQNDLPAIGLNRAAVADGRRHGLPVGSERLRQDLVGHGVIDKPIPHEIESDLLPRGEHGRSQVGHDDAFVGHRRSGEDHEAMIGDVNGASIDYRLQPFERVLREEVAAGHEIVVADLQRGSQEPGGIDLRAGSEQDAVGVDEKQPAVGLEATEDNRGIDAHDAIQRDGRDRRLGEADRLIGRDGKASPIQNGPVRSLLHRQGFRRLLDRGLSAGHLTLRR